MLLALDVGNTHVVVGLMEGREVRRSFPDAFVVRCSGGRIVK
mgnify:CR=1 FL=1